MPSPHITLFEADIALLCRDIDAIARKNHLTRLEVLQAVDSMCASDDRLRRAQTRLSEYNSGGFPYGFDGRGNRIL